MNTNFSNEKSRMRKNNLLQRFTKQKRRNLLAHPGPREAVVILDGLKPNFNIGKIFRSAYAFGVRKIHLTGVNIFDPAPSKGAFRHVPAVFDNNFKTSYTTLKEEGYSFFAFTPEGSESASLFDVTLPKQSCFIFGHEEFGHSFRLDDFQDLQHIHIPQVGEMESLNVSVAASIAMYEYSRQHPETTGNRTHK